MYCLKTDPVKEIPIKSITIWDTHTALLQCHISLNYAKKFISLNAGYIFDTQYRSLVYAYMPFVFLSGH